MRRGRAMSPPLLPANLVCAFNLPLAQHGTHSADELSGACRVLVRVRPEQRSSLLGRKEDHEDISFVGHTLRGSIGRNPRSAGHRMTQLLRRARSLSRCQGGRR